MTTAELVAVERRLIVAAVGRAGEGTGIVDPSLAERAIAAADRPLTAEQAAAVRAVSSSGHGVSVIQALAGTGKTYTAGVLRQVYEGAGYTVLGVAPTGRAVRELTEEAGIPTRTLDRLLLDLEQLGDTLPEGSVLILDEAGMAATRPSARLLEAAEHRGVKTIAIGDPGQLPSVQAGGWLGAVGRALGAQLLTEVMRQRDPAERRALGALHDGHPQRYLDWAERNTRIETFSDPASACEQALAEWAPAAATAGPAHTVMIARDNETRDRLNQGARELRRGLGALGEERSYGPVEVAVGDRVICRRNDGQLDVDNGMRGTVRHLDPDRVMIDTDGGLVRELPAAYVAEHVEHAYSLTGHGMQGGTIEGAIVVASPRDLTAGWSYTALSRARETTRLLVYDDDLERERSEFAPTDQTPTATWDELLERVGRRMLERDDEDLAIEQLPGPGRADDPTLASARTHATELPQEQAAARAEPTPLAAPTPARLQELSERIDQLHVQLAALPTRELQRIEDLDARALTLTTQHEQLTQRLAGLPEPRPRLGREDDSHAIERAHLASALQANEREFDAVRAQRGSLERKLGNPSEARAEREGLRTRNHPGDPRARRTAQRARRARTANPRPVGKGHFRRAARPARQARGMGERRAPRRAPPRPVQHHRSSRRTRTPARAARGPAARLGARPRSGRARRAAPRTRSLIPARHRFRDRTLSSETLYRRDNGCLGYAPGAGCTSSASLRPPKRRCRALYSVRACSSASRVKSGQSSSRKTSSE